MRASEFLIEYKLKVSKDSDGVAIRATAGGKQLGHAEFFFDEQGNLDPQTVWVDERFHGQGIARDMYDHLKGLGYTIVRSWDQTDAGKGFWDKHRGEDARIWERIRTTYHRKRTSIRPSLNAGRFHGLSRTQRLHTIPRAPCRGSQHTLTEWPSC